MADKRQFITLTNLGTFADEIKSKYALKGTDQDASSVVSLYGVKKYAQEQAAAVIGTAQDASSANTVYGAKALADEKVASVGATANKGIEMGGTATAPTVGIKLSSKAGNDLSFATGDGEDGGLYFRQEAAPTVSVAEKATPNTGYLKSYQVTVDGTAVGVDIDIPKDFLVKSATSGVVTAADKADGGKFHDNTDYAEGDAYLDFVINAKSGTATDEHVYVNVKNLVDVYHNGNGLNLDSTTNTFSIKLAATANGLSVDANGLTIALASASANGAMSSSDFSKLAGISAQANKTAVSGTGDGTGTIDGTAVTFYDIDTDVEAVTAQQVQALLA